MESWEGTGLKDNAKNRQRMEARAVLISEEIDQGTFNYLNWFPNGNRAALFRVVAEDHQGPQTIRQHSVKWLADKNPPIVKKSRGRKYRSHFTAHINPLHGDKYMHLYGMAEIREMLAHLTQTKGLSVKTAKNVMNATLRAFFRDAVAEKVITKNPFDELPKKWWPKVANTNPDPFEEKERDEILDYFFKKHWQKWPLGCVFLYILFWHGMRPSELTPRRWKDIDLRTGMLSITTSRTEGEEGTTKTVASARTIRLFTPALEYLKLIKPVRAQPDDYIFLDQRGKPINHWKFGEQHFQGALTALKIRHRDFYHTRHTAITVLLIHGEHPSAIAEHVGTSPEMIYKKYSKWILGFGTFGDAALQASKPKPFPKPLEIEEDGVEINQAVELVRGGGFEPPRHFWH